MREHPFDQEVQADEKVDHLVVVFLEVEPLSELVDLQNLSCQFVHLLLLQQVQQKLLLVDRSERLLYDLVLPVLDHQIKRSFVFLAAQIHFALKLHLLKQ